MQVRVRTDIWEVYKVLARILEDDGKYDEAIQILRESLPFAEVILINYRGYIGPDPSYAELAPQTSTQELADRFLDLASQKEVH